MLKSFQQLPQDQITKLILDLSDDEADALLHDWSVWARENQLPPEVDWSVWLNLGGRGSGKTRTGAEWVRGEIMSGKGRIALVGPTAADVRDVMVEGDSGIMNCCWKGDKDHKGRHLGRPNYEPSKRRLTWENGATAHTYTADEPDRLRGPQHDDAWCDEIVAWRYPQDAWDMLMFGLRLGSDPRALVSTTPKPTKFIKELINSEGVAMSRSTTYDNKANLAGTFFRKIVGKYEGTRIGRQELLAEVIEDVAGALWNRDELEQYRVKYVNRDDLVRIVVAIDPAATSNEGSDEHGIIVVGIDRNGHGYVLEDISVRGSPDEWGKRAVYAFDRWKADRIIGEANNGGDMVEHVVKSAAKDLKAKGRRKTDEISYKKVHASRGKVTRAEPVAALYEQGRIHHDGAFPDLEDQMCAFTIDFDRKAAGYSPDRLDAMVWGFTELMLGGAEPHVIAPDGVTRVSPWTGT